MGFSIITDTSANLPSPLLKERKIDVLPFSYYINGKEFQCLDTESFDSRAYYEAIRRGTKVTTSLVSPGVFNGCFRSHLEAGEDVLFIGMSSGISGSFNAARLTAASLREEYPDREIYTLDTIGASLGEGLLVLRAADLRDKGRSLGQTAAELEGLKEHMCQVFTVDDLMHLRSTGRLSNAAAVIGTVLNIKPLLKGNGRGQIVSFAKIRGRRRSIEGIAEQYDRLVERPAEQVIGIAHADCEGDMQYLCSLLRRNNPPKDIMVVDYEPVTGSHVGPGALALFFLGSNKFRDEQ